MNGYLIRKQNTFCLNITTACSFRGCLTFSLSTKEHIWDTMANSWTYSNRSCSGGHLSNHARLLRLSSRFCRNWTGRWRGSIIRWNSSTVRPTRLRWWCCRTRSGTTTRLTLPLIWVSNLPNTLNIRLTGIINDNKKLWANDDGGWRKSTNAGIRGRFLTCTKYLQAKRKVPRLATNGACARN